MKDAVDRWLTTASVATGRVFRAVSRHETPWGTGISENVVWYVIRICAQRLELDHLAPHDLRTTCAKLCYVIGGELEQIQFLLGHASVLTTERYLGCKQNLEEPVNDRFGSLFARVLHSRKALLSSIRVLAIAHRQRLPRVTDPDTTESDGFCSTSGSSRRIESGKESAVRGCAADGQDRGLATDGSLG